MQRRAAHLAEKAGGGIAGAARRAGGPARGATGGLPGGLLLVRRLPGMSLDMQVVQRAVPELLVARPMVGRAADRAHDDVVVLRKAFVADGALYARIVRQKINP